SLGPLLMMQRLTAAKTTIAQSATIQILRRSISRLSLALFGFRLSSFGFPSFFGIGSFVIQSVLLHLLTIANRYKSSNVRLYPRNGEFLFWSAAAERSGDAALDCFVP